MLFQTFTTLYLHIVLDSKHILAHLLTLHCSAAWWCNSLVCPSINLEMELGR